MFEIKVESSNCHSISDKETGAVVAPSSDALCAEISHSEVYEAGIIRRKEN
jgi:hypothetical protein